MFLNATAIFFARHARTVWNEEGRFQGQLDSPLSEEGKKQSELLGKQLQDINPELIFTSGLNRTKSTVEFALKSWGVSLPVFEHSGLNEINLGIWQGEKVEEVKTKNAELFDLYRYTPHLFRLQSAETFEVVQERFVNAIKDIISGFSGKKIFIVTHGLVLCSLLSYLRNIPFSYYSKMIKLFENTQILKTVWMR